MIWIQQSLERHSHESCSFNRSQIIELPRIPKIVNSTHGFKISWSISWACPPNSNTMACPLDTQKPLVHCMLISIWKSNRIISLDPKLFGYFKNKHSAQKESLCSSTKNWLCYNFIMNSIETNSEQYIFISKILCTQLSPGRFPLRCIAR